MGVFADWQPLYEERGFATFPVNIIGKDKKPAVGNYLRAGRPASRGWASKFPDSEAFGLALKPNRLTVLDIDTTNEKVLIDAMDRHGASPFVVRSGSGHFQAWYRHNGERREVRPDPRQPIDILGNGFVVAAPSKGTKGAYEIIQGSLDDLKTLPALGGLDREEGGDRSKIRPVEIPAGTRDDHLFRHLLGQARHVESLEELVDIGRYVNDTACNPPLTDVQVVAKARSAWGYEQRGTNWSGTGERVVVTHDTVDMLAATDPFAFSLLGILQRHHSGCEEFFLAKAMAASLGWSLARWRSARDTLVRAGIIVCIYPGGNGPNDPPRYRWGE